MSAPWLARGIQSEIACDGDVADGIFQSHTVVVKRIPLQILQGNGKLSLISCSGSRGVAVIRIRAVVDLSNHNLWFRFVGEQKLNDTVIGFGPSGDDRITGAECRCKRVLDQRFGISRRWRD